MIPILIDFPNRVNFLIRNHTAKKLIKKLKIKAKFFFFSILKVLLLLYVEIER